ncbi:MAG: hypothetical protein H6742_13430 [Alphaproteobacteria bacterium]|nr:hypothetical protein [Alphaproteobacteria bacterium]
MPPLTHPRLLLARLQAELAKPPGQGRIRRTDVLALVHYVHRCLRVMPYVRHSPGCRQAIRIGRAASCTCGLSAAWDGRTDDGAALDEQPESDPSGADPQRADPQRPDQQRAGDRDTRPPLRRVSS